MTASGHPFNTRAAPLVPSIDGDGDGRRLLHARTHRHHQLCRGEERLAEYFIRRCGRVYPLLVPNWGPLATRRGRMGVGDPPVAKNGCDRQVDMDAFARIGEASGRPEASRIARYLHSRSPARRPEF
jgi:hypothetical protein